MAKEEKKKKVRNPCPACGKETIEEGGNIRHCTECNWELRKDD